MQRRVNGVALREIRHLAGISQTELARRADIDQATLSNIENGKHGVSPQLTRKLAEGLKTSVDAITHLVPDPEPAADAEVVAS
jgi:transcriptional regulator with XRE-family HTH domain